MPYINAYRTGSSDSPITAPGDLQYDFVWLHVDAERLTETLTIKDESVENHTITPLGIQSIRTTNLPKYGSHSLLFNGLDNNMLKITGGTTAIQQYNDFTLECWMYPTAYIQQGIFGTSDGYSISATAASLNLTASGNLQFVVWNGYSTTGWTITGTLVAPLNQWSHVAVTRVGPQINLWLNGVKDTASYQSSQYFAGNYGLALGGRIGANNAPAALFHGYIDSVRFTQASPGLGACRYTANFTPPTEGFPISGPSMTPTDPDTWFLSHFDYPSGGPYSTTGFWPSTAQEWTYANLIKPWTTDASICTAWVDKYVNSGTTEPNPTTGCFSNEQSVFSGASHKTYASAPERVYPLRLKLAPTGHTALTAAYGLNFAGTFTAEYYFHPTSVHFSAIGLMAIGMWRTDLTTYMNAYVEWNGSSIVVTGPSTTGTWITIASGALASIALNTWHHFAFVKYGAASFAIYLDGVRILECTSLPGNFLHRSLGTGENQLCLGGGKISSGVNSRSSVQGYIDEVRISTTARYSGASFTLPMAQFPL